MVVILVIVTSRHSFSGFTLVKCTHVGLQDIHQVATTTQVAEEPIATSTHMINMI